MIKLSQYKDFFLEELEDGTVNMFNSDYELLQTFPNKDSFMYYIKGSN